MEDQGREKNAPTRHDSRVPMHSRRGFCPVSFWCCKNSQQKLFLAKTEGGWEAAQRCATYPASSARARVQKCTKMQAGRSFDVASAKFSTFTHKLLEMSFDHIGLNNSCCWKRWWLIWWEALFLPQKTKSRHFFKPKKVLSEPFMAARVKETLQTCALADRCPLSLKPHKGHFSFEI